MKQFAHIVVVCLLCLSSPAIAQQEEDSGKGLMEQGAEMFWEGLRKEMGPALDDLQGLADQFASEIGPSLQDFMARMGPALAGIAAEVGDWSRYDLPEILPNGDIIIRKKPAAPQEPSPPQDSAPPSGVTDL